MLRAHDPHRVDGTGDCYHVSGLVWRRDRGILAASAHNESGEIFSPCAAAALYRREAFLEIGGFDEDFFCYLEDVDLGFRLRLQGHRCRYVANATVADRARFEQMRANELGGREPDCASCQLNPTMCYSLYNVRKDLEHYDRRRLYRSPIVSKPNQLAHKAATSTPFEYPSFPDRSIFQASRVNCLQSLYD